MQGPEQQDMLTMQDFPDVDAYLVASTHWPDEIRALRSVLLGMGLSEEIKWGKPCYLHGDANIVLMQEFKDNLALLFFKGILLKDPDDVLEAIGPNSHAARRMMFTSVDEVTSRAGVVEAYVREAIEVEASGAEVPPKPDEDLAPELAERLADDPELAQAFDDLTPGRQRGYNLHVSGAKQSSTRAARVEKFVPKILAGKGMRDR